MEDQKNSVVPVTSDSLSIQSTGAGRGLAWVGEGFDLFMRAPLLLGVMGLLFLVVYTLVMMIPILGWLVVTLFWPHLIAGLFLAARHADESQPVEIGDLFEPFSSANMPLLTLGAIYLAAMVGVMVVMLILSVAAIGMTGMQQMMGPGMMEGGDPAMMFGQMGMSLLLVLLVSLALMIPVMMAFLFAPLLVHQRGVEPTEALALSFRACLRNLLPFLLWGLLWLVVFIAITLLMIIPVIGWLLGILFFVILTPLMCTNLYRAYRDIFVASESTPQSAPL